LLTAAMLMTADLIRTDCSESLRNDPALGYAKGDRSCGLPAGASTKTKNLDVVAMQFPITQLFEEQQEQQPDPATVERERKAQIQVWAHLDQLIAQVPEGQTIDPSKFDQIFGDKAAMLSAAGMTRIARTNGSAGNDHVSLGFRSEKVAETGDFRLSHKQTVEFDFNTKTSELSQISGLTVGKHYLWWHDATIEKVKISHDANDNTVFFGSGHWGLLSGSTTLIIGRDAQVVQLKKGQTVAEAIKKMTG
jgi:hypothetical protein